ncbi:MULTISPECIES: hypothetical protein [Francisella]|uniref:Nuclear transport factor 2 family protein n=1 Tax=Francisella opportunistica TaxID=2016517 RepID=A0A345JPS5_9GAMM|nr:MULTISPECIES: hypothetical protein [Francisella]APC90997.1 hypothetical protein BBG19_0259 [Francisella sp. MA067296]AXH29321.1 nuclear transport factor 2 family protein [Francisella opportunistica]AXH30972.1 hypothetical protein CGC44_01285 [Francisella opportunistica]AXH32619.1 hypothetical protein CGC45_01285 [Francisella opportunistica]
MKKILLVITSMLIALTANATGDCSDKIFSKIKTKAKLMESAWDSGNVEKVVSFYDNDFIYMSGGKPYTTKNAVLKHYLDSFAANASSKRDLGKLTLNYQYCKNLGSKHQLVILKFILKSSDGKLTTGNDLLVWHEDSKGDYKIIVDFPQS